MSSAVASLEALAATSEGVRKMPAPTTIPTVIAIASLSRSVGTGAPRPPAAGRERPDLVLMDGSLPGLDGLSATRRIREKESLRGVPIVALSGHVGEDFRAEAKAAGATHCSLNRSTFRS